MAKFIDIVLRAKDLFSAKTDKAAESIGGLKTEIKALDKELKEVEQAQEAVKIFTELSAESKSLAQAVEQSQASLKKYAQQQANASQVAEKAEQEYKELKAQVTALNSAYSKQNKALSDNGVSLNKAKTTMNSYEESVKNAKRNIESTNTAYTKQKAVFTELSAQYKGSKAPLDSLTDSYKNAKAQLNTLEQTQRAQLKTLAQAEASYKASVDDVSVLAKAQKSYATSLEKTEQSLKENTTAQQQASAKQKESNAELSAASANYKATAKAVQTLSARLTKINADLDKTNGKLKAAGVDANNFSAATGRLSDKQKQLTAATQKAFTALTTLTSKLKGIRGVTARAGVGISGFTSQLLALGGTYLSIRGLANTLVSFVSIGAKFEVFGKQFEGIMGSVAQGEQAFQWVKDFARETPLDMEQTTQAFIMLKGAGLDPMDGTLRALTDSTAKYTGGTAKLENITRQLSQAWAKGRINADDMRIAVDNGLPAWVLLSQATGKTVGQLRNLSEAGKLGRYELKLLFQELGNDALGASAKLIGAFNGQLAVAKFNIQEFLDTIAQSGALDSLTSKLTSLNAEVKEMAADGRLKAYAQELSNSFVKMVDSTSASLKSLFTDLDGFATQTKKTFAAISVGANVVTIGMKAIISSFSAAIKVVANFQSNVLSAFGLIPNAASKAAEEVAKFFKAMEDEATKQMYEDIDKFNAALAVLNDVSGDAGGAVTKLGQDIGKVNLALEPFGDALDLTAEQALNLARNMIATGDQIGSAGLPIDRLKETISVLLAKLQEDPSPKVQETIGKLKVIYGSLGDKVKETSTGVVKELKDLELEFQNLGGKTLDDLKENVEKTAQVFDRFSEAKKPVSELRQAFLQQLDAQLALAKAQESTVLPANTALQASVLGLTQEYKAANTELDQHNAKISGLAEVAEYLAQRQDKLNKATQQTTNATKKQAQAQEALNKANAAAESHAGANVAFQKLWNEAKERSIQLYDLAALSVEQLSDRVGELGSQLSNAFKDQSWSNILKPINDLTNSANRNELAAIAQEEAYRKLFAQMESGSLTIEQLDHYARTAGESFDQLSKTRLDALQNQINTAKNAARELKNELTDTLTDLQNELDQLEGNQQAVIRRNYDADKKELEVKLEQARKTGDAKVIDDAREALAIQREIFDLKTASAKSENINTTKKITENNNTNTNVKQSVQVQELRYTVTFKAANASSTFTGGGKDVENFLKQLQDQGLTVTRG